MKDVVNQQTDVASWYFAYGSNLSKARINERLNTVPKASLAMLKGYRIAFNKRGDGGETYASIVQARSDTVWGVTYLCTAKHWAILDGKEGVCGGHYRRIPIQVDTIDGERLDAETYIAGEDFIIEERKPSSWYLDLILTGAKEWGLPADYISQIRANR